MHHSAIKVALTVLISCVVLSACGGAQSRKQRHMARGQEYMQAGNLEKARVEFRNALQIEPNDAEARFLYAESLERLGNLREAAGMYQAAIDTDGGHLRARASLARMFVFAGAPERALEYVEPGLAQKPDDPELLTSRAAARLQLKDVAGATSDVLRARELAPDSENATALLASIYRQQGENERAIAMIRETLAKTPKSIDLRQVLASLYSETGDTARAEEQMRAVIGLAPAESAHRYQLALFLMRGGKVAEAETVMAEAVSARPDETGPKLALVDFIATQRGADAAELRLKEYIAQDTDNDDLRLGLAALQERHGKSDAAVATLQDLVRDRRLEPAALTARNRLAAIHARQGRYEPALALVSEVLAENPRDNDALLLRGNIALERQQPDAAIADLRAVLRDQPQSTGILRTLARAHLANGEPALAEENLRAAVAAGPNDMGATIELAQLLMGSKRAAQAVTLLEVAVRRMPQDVAARTALVQAYVANKDLPTARIAAEDLKILAPKSANSYYLAALVAQSEGRLADSERELEAALALQPAAADALSALARSMLAAGRATEAEARVRKVADADPGHIAARNLLGELLLARKDYSGATREFQQVIARSPDWWLPYRNLALAQLGAGANDAALATLKTGMKASGGAPALATELAALHERLGRFNDAIQVYDELHRRAPRSELAANNLAMLLVTYRSDPASLDRALDLTAGFANSENPALIDTLAWVRVRRGEYSAALPLLERAARQVPESQVIRYHLAAAQFHTGQRDAAEKNLELALAGKPSFNGVEGARAMLAELRK